MDKNHPAVKWLLQLSEEKPEELNERIDAEFQQIPGPFGSLNIGNCRVGKQIEGTSRYPNVPCLEASRVCVKDPLQKGHDFIHANYVTLPNGPCKFIASMAPKSTEIPAFWSVIWQERISAVYCLTRLSEGESKKATIYWPEKGVLHSAHFTIWKVKATSEVGYTVTTYEVRNARTNEVRRITHWFYEDWPDHSGPLCTHVLLDIAEKLIQDPPTGAVVHCSAGIGRTGAFLGIIAVMTKIQIGENPTIMDVVKMIRSQRAWSVQVLQQYRLLYWATILHIIRKSSLTTEEKSALRQKLSYVRVNATHSQCSVLATPAKSKEVSEVTTTMTAASKVQSKPTTESLLTIASRYIGVGRKSQKSAINKNRNDPAAKKSPKATK